MDDFATVVEQSASVNESQLVGKTDGKVIVPTYDWTNYFATLYKKIDGIKGYYHFKFDAQSPGVVSLRCVCDGPVTEVTGRQELIEDKLPPLVPPKGLSMKDSGTFMTKLEGTAGMNVKISLVLSLIHHDYLHVSQHQG